MAVSREERTERLLRDRDAARAAGRRVGGATPYGWRLDRGQLAPVAHEQHVRWLILHLHRQGLSIQRIADQLDALGLSSRTGSRWSKSAVHSVATRSVAELEDTG